MDVLEVLVGVLVWVLWPWHFQFPLNFGRVFILLSKGVPPQMELNRLLN